MRSHGVDRVLGRYVEYESRTAELRRSLWLKLAYPLTGLTAAVAIFSFIALFVVVPFEAIFRDFGVELPPLTIGVLHLAGALRKSGLMLLALCGGFVALWLVSSLILPARWGQSLVCLVPVLGPVWRWSALAGLFHLLGLLLESKIPLPEALTLADDATPDADLGVACRKMAREVGAGRPLADAVARRSVMPRGLTSILGWAERSQALPDTCHMLGEMYEARARAQASFAGTVCAVMVLLLVVFGSVATVLALMLPIIRLISRLTG
jgi:type II secretory pathway component PulF